MANVDTLELVSQDNGLIKSTPAEETLVKIVKMRAENVKANTNSRMCSRMGRMSNGVLVYCVKYLKNRHWLSNEQIYSLSSEDLNRIPEIIFAERGRKVLLWGWVPIFGWVFAGKYISFKNRVRFLRSFDKNIFDKGDIKGNIIRAINFCNESPGDMLLDKIVGR